MSNVLKMLSRGGAAAAETDPNFNQTVLLLHGDGTNGAQNNTFLDGSTNNFTITRNGNTTQGTFSPFSVGAGEWSNFFDNNGDFLTGASNSAYNFSGDFTIEAWVYYDKSSGNNTIIDTRSSDALAAYGFGINNAKLDFLFRSSGTTRITSSASVPLHSWNHVAVSRSGSTIRLFINGVQDGSVVDSATITAQSFPSIGGGRASGTNTVTGYYFSGYISNLRILNGTGYSTMTVPTAPLTAITNTSLLTCQSNRFVDNSTNAFAITRNGDVRVTPFSPFAPNAAYSAGTNGGSGYFDGTGDYLSVADNAALDIGTGDFQISFWVYPTAFAGSTNANTIFFKSTNNIVVDFNNSGTINVAQYGVAVRVSSSVNITLNQWAYIVVSRVSSTTKIFLNGAEVGSASDTSNYDSATAAIIGLDTNNTNQRLTGYLADFRLVKGSGVTSVTVPTTPLTAITNTSLLLNFTNAGIIDNTGKNNLETVGNAQIDTTTKKYGTGSLEFDGTGDSLTVPDQNINWEFGSGAFTVEFWTYLSNVSTLQCFMFHGWAGSGGLNFGWQCSINSSGQLLFYANGIRTFTDLVFTANTWHHVAICGDGSGVLSAYLNGTKSSSTPTYTSIVARPSANLCIGGFNDASENLAQRQFVNGFIDDLRITKGVARYTANFTAPTKEFPDL